MDKTWCDLYIRQGNSLFIPEHRFDNTVAAKAAYSIGHYESIGFAPFSVESSTNPENEPPGKMYKVISQLFGLFDYYKEIRMFYKYFYVEN
jgi:hypothetical protein